MSQYYSNPYLTKESQIDRELKESFLDPEIKALHHSLPEYKPTPLVSLPGLSVRLNLGRILVKDESFRFGLKAFKALGSTYAVYKIINGYFKEIGRREFEADKFYRSVKIEPNLFTFCTATDGNHGRAVAWVAKKLGQKAVIYMPSKSTGARIKTIEGEGALVKLVDGSYDDAVNKANIDSKKYGWQIVSDTSWAGYYDIPNNIMAGYLTMFREISDLIKEHEDIDVAFIQAGVGALAAAAAWYYKFSEANIHTRLISVEPDNAACLLNSIKSQYGELLPLEDEQDSIMAGLNCGTPSATAWPLIRTGFDLFMTIPDRRAVEAMRLYYNPLNSDPRVISGESGAAGLAGLLALCSDPDDKRKLIDLNHKSTVLVINTEGDTDPETFDKLVRQFS